MATIKAGQLAKLLKITPHQLREWQKVLELVVPRDEQGHRIYNETWVSYFQAVRQRVIDEEWSFSDVSRLIQAPSAPKQPVIEQPAVELEFVY